MLSTQEALNEIARQLMIHNQIEYLRIMDRTSLIYNMDDLNILKHRDQLETPLPLPPPSCSKPINVWCDNNINPF